MIRMIGSTKGRKKHVPVFEVEPGFYTPPRSILQTLQPCQTLSFGGSPRTASRLPSQFSASVTPARDLSFQRHGAVPIPMARDRH